MRLDVRPLRGRMQQSIVGGNCMEMPVLVLWTRPGWIVMDSAAAMS